MLNDSLQLTVVMLTEFRQCSPLSQSKCSVVSPNLANPTFFKRRKLRRGSYRSLI